MDIWETNRMSRPISRGQSRHFHLENSRFLMAVKVPQGASLLLVLDARLSPGLPRTFPCQNGPNPHKMSSSSVAYRQAASREDWERMKSTITDIWVNRAANRAHLIEILFQEYGFIAT